MSEAVRLVGAFGFAMLVAAAATPVAIRVAARTNFFDQPLGYKAHGKPTPYLGGAAVLCGFLAGFTVFTSDVAQLAPIAAGATVLWFVGTIDDRVTVSPGRRVAAEAAAATLLWATSNGWDVFGSPVLDLALTIAWIVAVVNAFNLMDNMDGAAGSVASVSALGAAVLAVLNDHPALACAALALAGACLGFLPYNLRRPARIFLGDGGSMPVGFVVAATVMAVADDGGLGLPGVLAAAILVALPILDTTMVVISRRRRGVSVLTGGRDHMTHRLRARLPSARAVAVVLGGLQAILCAAAIGAAQMGSPSLVGLCAVLLVLGASTIGMLETGMWAAPAAGGSVSVDVSRSRAGSITSTASVGMSASVVAGVVGLSAGLSPFVHGAYALSTWGPAALAVAALAVGVSANRTDRFSRPAIAALGSIGFLWVWALASSVWAESADNAMLDAARWLLYATGLLVLVILLQDRRARNVALGAFTGGALVVLAYIAVRIGTGHTSSLFLGARLNGPLGYVNGQAAALLLAFWPLMALAESGRHAALRGSALGAASLLLGVLLLTQTRAVVPALGLSVIALVAVVPGRERRLWALIVIAGALAAVAGSVLDVYSSNAGGTPPVDVVEHAGRWLVVASALAGCVWGIGGAFVSRARAKGASPVERISRPALAVICVVALVGALAAVGNPVERVRGEVHSFVDLKAAGTADSRFLSGGGYRYDYWRVAVRQLQAEPVHGVGAGNFTRTYYRDRHTIENVRQAHSIELQVLGELGLVGGIALGILLTVILVAFGRVAYLARNDPRRIAVAVGAGGLFITWLAHASVDWLNLLPGITGAALIAATVLLLESGGTPRRVTSGGRTAVLGIAVAFAVVAVVTTGRLILADHYRKAAASEAAADPRAALAASGQSIHLNGQGLSARYVRAAAFARLGDYDAAKSSLLDATELEPHNFVSWALLGDLSTRRGDRTAALRYYQRAHALNPLDPSLKQLARG